MIVIPDSAERARALDARRSFIVQAPAGSGKTELLIQRYLTLLARVEAPEAVVAITFTKKAAGEMRQRVIAALRNSAGPRPQEEHAALTWQLACAVRARSEVLGWDLFRNPSRFQIRTIDSLCASLVQRMPWLSRMGASPAIVEDADAADLYTEAARRTIELLETGPWPEAIETLLAHLDYDFLALQEMLAQLLARRDQWLRHIAGVTDLAGARSALESALRHAIADGVTKARRSVPSEFADEVVGVVAAAGRNLSTACRDGAAIACAGMTRLPGADEVESWLGIVETLLKKDDDWRKSLTIANGFPPKSADKRRAEELIASLARMNPCGPRSPTCAGFPSRTFPTSSGPRCRPCSRSCRSRPRNSRFASVNPPRRTTQRSDSRRSARSGNATRRRTWRSASTSESSTSWWTSFRTPLSASTRSWRG